MKMTTIKNVLCKLEDNTYSIGDVCMLGEELISFKPHKDEWTYPQFTPLLKIRKIKYK